MKFFRNNWYWILGIVIGIGSIITVSRVQQQTSEPEHISPGVAKPSISEAPGKTSHGTPNAEVLRKRRPVRINMAARNNPALKIGPILAVVHDDIIEPPPSLPTDALQRLNRMLRPLSDAGSMCEMAKKS